MPKNQAKLTTVFKGQNIIEFNKQFKDDKACHEYIAEIKWAEGYKCRKCGYDKFTVRKRNLPEIATYAII